MIPSNADTKTAANSVREATDKVVEQGREYGDQIQNAISDWLPPIRKAIKEKPVATLAGAAVLGLVVGALLKK
jgi:ElaB/YqjD/DUF883 family membrane-anchored ribosome-binding protein